MGSCISCAQMDFNGYYPLSSSTETKSQPNRVIPAPTNLAIRIKLRSDLYDDEFKRISNLLKTTFPDCEHNPIEIGDYVAWTEDCKTNEVICVVLLQIITRSERERPMGVYLCYSCCKYESWTGDEADTFGVETKESKELLELNIRNNLYDKTLDILITQIKKWVSDHLFKVLSRMSSLTNEDSREIASTFYAIVVCDDTFTCNLLERNKFKKQWNPLAIIDNTHRVSMKNEPCQLYKMETKVSLPSF